MTYDIPPPLQHKEKIIFGLTFIQLAYALPSLLLILLLIFKLPLPIEFSGAISIIPLSLAVFFMFFDGKNKTTNFIKHLKTQEADVENNKLKDVINIKEVKEEVVILLKTNLLFWKLFL